ncbi:MAG: hypothetical protein ALAOOOJD_01326 [bacterium]|nr:hypothetical protein [bacterium]
MTNYFLAAGAMWLAIAIIASFGHLVVLGKTYKRLTPRLDDETGKRRLPLHYIANLAFALIFAYLLRLAWPAEVPLLTGALFGFLAGLAIYLPQMLNQFATFPYPTAMVFGSALIGILQTTVAGVIGGLIL